MKIILKNSAYLGKGADAMLHLPGPNPVEADDGQAQELIDAGAAVAVPDSKAAKAQKAKAPQSDGEKDS